MDDEIRALLADMSMSQAGHPPVVAAFLRRIGLAGAVNAAVPSEMAVDIGTFVSLMVSDTLPGRSPLYRLAEFASSVDTGLPLGEEVPANAFNHTTVGRAVGRHLRGGHGKGLFPGGLISGKRLPPGR